MFYGAQLHVYLHVQTVVYICVCVSTEGPAPPRPSSSAPPVFGLWWPWWGPLSLPRHRAPGWHRGRECPPGPSLLPGTTSQTRPPTPRAEATSCVDRKQEGSSAVAVSVVLFGTQYLWWDPVDTLQQWFVYFVVILRKITLRVKGSFMSCLFKGTIHRKIRQSIRFLTSNYSDRTLKNRRAALTSSTHQTEMQPNCILNKGPNFHLCGQTKSCCSATPITVSSSQLSSAGCRISLCSEPHI